MFDFIVDRATTTLTKLFNTVDNVLTVAEQGTGLAADYSTRARKAREESDELLQEAANKRMEATAKVGNAMADNKLAAANAKLAELKARTK